MRKELPVVVNKHFISFSWGVKCLTNLKTVAAQNGFALRILMDENEIAQLKGFTHAFVMGVDKGWINSVLDTLAANNTVGVLIYSDMDDARPNSFIINADQASVIRQSIEHLVGNGKRRLALFGVQENDISDASKAASFCEAARASGLAAGEEDVYKYGDDILQCFRMFCENITKYDAVICANDIVGVFFIQSCKAMGVNIPADLYVTGNGNTWIGSHSSPTLTTVDGKADETNVFSELIVQQYRLLCTYPQVESMHILLSSEVVGRESTGYVYRPTPIEDAVPLFRRNEIHLDYIKDPTIRQLSMLDRELSFCNNTSLKIIRAQCENSSYQKTAEELFISVDTVKYRLKKIYKALNVKSRYELAYLLDKYGIILG